jgi:hypothetical protein
MNRRIIGTQSYLTELQDIFFYKTAQLFILTLIIFYFMHMHAIKISDLFILLVFSTIRMLLGVGIL